MTTTTTMTARIPLYGVALVRRDTGEMTGYVGIPSLVIAPTAEEARKYASYAEAVLAAEGIEAHGIYRAHICAPIGFVGIHA